MPSSPAPLLCIDIGNTSAHCGLCDAHRISATRDIPTTTFAQNPALLAQHFPQLETLPALAFCSVVPTATATLVPWLKNQFPHLAIYHLRCDTLPAGFGLDYPNPPEIGGDRLANSCAAFFHFGTPAVVISMGTATVIDVITPKGYSGGIIAPGLALMADYLHEKTALLPRLDRFDLESPNHWGQSTIEAMKIGAHCGYTGLVNALLQSVSEGLRQRFPELPPPTLILTGGNAFILSNQNLPTLQREPHLALKGLREAFLRQPHISPTKKS